ncbi:thioredoxin family protein [Candidatus Dependentiae bacterium]|nr:thioredoxin family protein [Candidatus Dependentiae bacterium]
MKFIMYLNLSLILCLSLSAKEVKKITSIKEFKEAMNQPKPLVIMFYAPWCGASKEMTGALNQAATTLGSQAIFIKVDVENEAIEEVTDLFCIDAIPTLVIKHTGRVLSEDLVASVKSLTKKPPLQPKKKEPLTKKESPTKKPQPPAQQKKAPAPSSQKQQGSSKK